MSKKIYIYVIGIILSMLLLPSCTKVPSSATIQFESNYLNDSKFFIYNLDWVDSDTLVCQMCLTDMKSDGSDIGRVVSWNVSTKQQKLLYEGKDMAGFMPTGIVIAREGQFFTFDGKACVIFEDSKLKQIVKAPESIYGLYPSINGQFVARGEEGLEVFPANDSKRRTLVKKEQIKTTTDGAEYTVIYEGPRWSPDGKWIAFYQIAPENVAPPKIGIISEDRNQEKVFEFEKATNFAWSTDSEHIIAINEGTMFGGPLEIRVFNITFGEKTAILFDEPIDNQKIAMFNILDVSGSKILLQTHFDYQDKHVQPILLCDWKTGEKRFITDLDYWSVAAAFSPDGKTAAVAGDNKKGEPIQLINIE